MKISFKEYLIEMKTPLKQESIELFITLGDHKDDKSTEISLIVDYHQMEDDQDYDHNKPTYILNPESIEYTVKKDFEYNNIKYKAGNNLKTLFDNVFFDDSYTKKSDFLKKNISNYFMKESLNVTAKLETFEHLLELMIEEQL